MSIQRLSNSGQSGYRYKSLIAGITPVASVPVIGTATELTFSTASVTFTAPGAYGATTFTATSSPGGLTGTSATSPITVSGLSEQTAYTFTVTATNASGTSSPSAASNSITTPAAFTPENGYDALASITLAASSSSVTFAGIPTNYKHLQIRYSLTAAAAADTTIRFNDDTGSNYASHLLRGNGSAAQAYSYTSQSAANVQFNIGYNVSVAVIDVLDYQNLNKNKTIRSFAGWDNNGNGNMDLWSGAWFSTSAVTSCTLTAATTTFSANSIFALYGVK
jgi:hypothetical protein